MMARAYRRIAMWWRTSLARAWCETAVVTILLCLVDPGSADLRVVAQQMLGQSRWRMVVTATVLTLDQEKAIAAEPGSDFKECASGCPDMIVIPAGKFTMGSPENEPDREASEGPQHEVTIAEPFAVSKFEVSFEEWDACVAAGQCRDVAAPWGRGPMPVINVSWYDATQYVLGSHR
jgi:formylglycine-generating enzyme required for sulfatase activity